MKTEAIMMEFNDIAYAVNTLKEECESRLEELGYEEETYEEESDDEIERILEVWNSLEEMSCYC